MKKTKTIKINYEAIIFWTAFIIASILIFNYYASSISSAIEKNPDIKIVSYSPEHYCRFNHCFILMSIFIISIIIISNLLCMVKKNKDKKISRKIEAIIFYAGVGIMVISFSIVFLFDYYMSKKLNYNLYIEYMCNLTWITVITVIIAIIMIIITLWRDKSILCSE